MGEIRQKKNHGSQSLASILATLVYTLGFALGEVWGYFLGGHGQPNEDLFVRVLLAGLLSMAVLRAQAAFASTKIASIAMVFLCLFGVSPAAEAWLHATAAWLDLTPPVFTWNQRILSLSLSTAMGAVALVWFSPKMEMPKQPPQSQVKQTDFRFGALVWLILSAVILRLGVGFVDAVLEIRPGQAFTPLEVANPWLRLQGVGSNWGTTKVFAWRDVLSALGFLGLLFVRECLRILPLWWWMRRLQSRYTQPQAMSLVKRLLGWFWPLFVLGEFTPLLLGDAAFTSNWLMLGVTLGFARAGILAMLGVWCLRTVKQPPA